MHETWRDRFRPLIAELISKLGDIPVEEKRKALRGSCPATFRGYFPYKIWCDEVKVQLKLKVNPRDKQVKSTKGQKPLF